MEKGVGQGQVDQPIVFEYNARNITEISKKVYGYDHQPYCKDIVCLNPTFFGKKQNCKQASKKYT